MFEVMNVSGAAIPEVIVKAPSESGSERPRVGVVAVSMLAVIACVWLAYLLWDHGSKRLFVPRSDYTTLAGVVLLAAAIERFLEPISSFLLPSKKEKSTADDAKAEAKTAASDPAISRALVEGKVQEAADANAALAKKKNERQIAFWAIATVVGLFAAALMGVFLIGAIADVTAGARPNRVLDLTITGLVIGAGTKPTHDLIESLGKKASAAKAA